MSGSPGGELPGREHVLHRVVEGPVAPARVILLADSQLLFADSGGALASLREHVSAFESLAAYLGAANGDDPAFFDLCRAAMARFGILRCVHVHATPDAAQRSALAHADVVVLAGGDPLRGWRALVDHGLDEVLRERHRGGSTLVGVSAGAMQLGSFIAHGAGAAPVRTLGLVDAVVGVHEDVSWPELTAAVEAADAPRGIGIPAGAGIAVHAPTVIEPLRHAAHLCERSGEAWSRRELPAGRRHPLGR